MNSIILIFVTISIIVSTIILFRLFSNKSYNCIDGSCIELNNDSGTYKTMDECNNKCKISYVYNKDTNQCDKVNNNSGYKTEEECNTYIKKTYVYNSSSGRCELEKTMSGYSDINECNEKNNVKVKYVCNKKIGTCEPSTDNSGIEDKESCNKNCFMSGTCNNVEIGMSKEKVINCCSTDQMSDMDYKTIENKCFDNSDKLNEMISCCKGECKTLSECKENYPCTTKYVENMLTSFYSNKDTTSPPDEYKVHLINTLLQNDNSDFTIGRTKSNVQCVNYVKPQNPEFQKYIDEMCKRASEGEIIGNLDITCNIQKPVVESHFECDDPKGIYKTICEVCSNAKDLNNCALFNIDKIIGKTPNDTCDAFNNVIVGDMSKTFNNNYPCRKCLLAKYKKMCGEIPYTKLSVHGPEGYEPKYLG